jgi:hypothetical protein
MSLLHAWLLVAPAVFAAGAARFEDPPKDASSRTADFTQASESFIGVPMGSFATGKLNRGLKTLGTHSVLTCTAVTFYDPLTKTGGLAHFDSQVLSEAATLEILKDFEENGVDLERLQVNFFTSVENDRVLAGIERALDGKGVRQKRFFKGNGNHSSLLLDLSSGEIDFPADDRLHMPHDPFLRQAHLAMREKMKHSRVFTFLTPHPRGLNPSRPLPNGDELKALQQAEYARAFHAICSGDLPPKKN